VDWPGFRSPLTRKVAFSTFCRLNHPLRTVRPRLVARVAWKLPKAGIADSCDDLLSLFFVQRPRLVGDELIAANANAITLRTVFSPNPLRCGGCIDRHRLQAVCFQLGNLLLADSPVGISAAPVGTLHTRMVPDADILSLEVEALCATARWCYARGWVPATSGNFSVRSGGRIFITPTGLDKGKLTPADLLEIDLEGRAVSGHGRPSAETSLHTVIYRERIHARAILHVHTIWNTLLSGKFVSLGYVPLQGYELLKGLTGVSTHEHTERVPIIANTQVYTGLAAQLSDVLRENADAHGVLLSRHGLYTWGESVAEARRHLEVFEFLFEVEGRQLFNQPA
jgi:methylthioribulose-1-phosphate dehydratase